MKIKSHCALAKLSAAQLATLFDWLSSEEFTATQKKLAYRAHEYATAGIDDKSFDRAARWWKISEELRLKQQMLKLKERGTEIKESQREISRERLDLQRQKLEFTLQRPQNKNSKEKSDGADQPPSGSEEPLPQTTPSAAQSTKSNDTIRYSAISPQSTPTDSICLSRPAGPAPRNRQNPNLHRNQTRPILTPPALQPHRRALVKKQTKTR